MLILLMSSSQPRYALRSYRPLWLQWALCCFHPLFIKEEMTRRLFVKKPTSYTFRASGSYLDMDGAFRAVVKEMWMIERGSCQNIPGYPLSPSSVLGQNRQDVSLCMQSFSLS